MNQFRMTLEQFEVLFEPLYGWPDYEAVQADYLRFLRAVEGLKKEDVLARIMGDR